MTIKMSIHNKSYKISLHHFQTCQLVSAGLKQQQWFVSQSAIKQFQNACFTSTTLPCRWRSIHGVGWVGGVGIRET